jgi:DNA repair exonuclease SbcCD ATPase subunit
LTEARELIQEAARITEKTAHRQIESVVTTCLQSVFGDEYSFRINFEKKRGRTEAHLKLVKDSEDMDPLSATGGGAVDVLSFALRVTCLILALPRRRRFMVLDEPFKHLSVEYRERVGELLQTLAKDLGIQFLIVTHMPELQIGKVIRL